MDTNKDYEHPILGKITDDDIQHIIWNREAVARFRAEDDAKKAKLDEIIKRLKEIDDGLLDCDCWSRLDEEIEMLEKFKEEEL